VRLFDGNAVMRRLTGGKGREFGFGGITDIFLNQEKGVRLGGRCRRKSRTIRATRPL
jgi:hypothetical protein